MNIHIRHEWRYEYVLTMRIFIWGCRPVKFWACCQCWEIDRWLFSMCIFIHKFISYRYIHSVIYVTYVYSFVLCVHSYVNAARSILGRAVTIVKSIDSCFPCVYIYSLLHLECHSISISNLNLPGLFSMERGKRDLVN